MSTTTHLREHEHDHHLELDLHLQLPHTLTPTPTPAPAHTKTIVFVLQLQLHVHVHVHVHSSSSAHVRTVMPPQSQTHAHRYRRSAKSKKKIATKKTVHTAKKKTGKNGPPFPPVTGGKGDPFFFGMDAEEREEIKEPAGALTIDDSFAFGVHLEGEDQRESLGGMRARFKWVLANLVGRRGIDCRMLIWDDVDINEKASAPEDAARLHLLDPDTQADCDNAHPFRVRIGNSKSVPRNGEEFCGHVRGELVWLPIHPEPRTPEFLRRAIRRLRFGKGARGEDTIFPSLETDKAVGYEASAKRVREARRTFIPKDALSCRPSSITTHTPRRSFATAHWRLNTPPHIIRKFTGHEDLDALHTYVMQGGVFMREAAQKLKF